MSQNVSNACRAVVRRIPHRIVAALNTRSITTSAACRVKKPQSLAEADSRPVKAVRQMEFNSYNLNPYPRLSAPSENAPSMSIPLIKQKWESVLEKAQKADQAVTLTGTLLTDCGITWGICWLNYVVHFRTNHIKKRV